MNSSFSEIITEQIDIFLYNIEIAIKTCDLHYVLFNVPIWKHVYHMLHSLDKWFINPNCYEEPSFHESNMNNIDVKHDGELSREQLQEYFDGICKKIRVYMGTMNDEMLKGKPEGCEYTRLALIMGQFRHLYSHLGNVNATTIIAEGRWPRVMGLDARKSDELFE